MNTRLAMQADSKNLIDFYKNFLVESSIQMKIDRHDNYFLPYQNQSKDSKTFILESEKQIKATSSFVFKQVEFQNQIKNLAFIKDIRVAPESKALIHWTNHFTDIMKDIQEANKIDTFFTLIGETEFKNLNKFVRPRQLKKALPRYFLYRTLEVVTVHGQYPWAPPPLQKVRIKQADESIKEKLLAYLLRKSQYRSFRFFWDEDSFDHMMRRIKPFDLSHFLVALDQNEDVIGALSLWSGSGVEDYIPYHYNLRGHNFRQYLKLMSSFGIARALPKPVTRTGVESDLQFQFLNHIYCDNEDIFDSLVHYAFYEKLEKKEFLVYPRFENHIMLKSSPHWITTSHPYYLYCIVLPNQSTPDFVHPKYTLSPDIEFLNL